MNNQGDTSNKTWKKYFKDRSVEPSMAGPYISQKRERDGQENEAEDEYIRRYENTSKDQQKRKDEETTLPNTSPLLIPVPHDFAPIDFCHMKIVEEPDMSLRFRYSSEGHSNIIYGQTSTRDNKTFPTLKLENVPDHINTVNVRVGLYMEASPDDHHVHQLRWKKRGQEEVVGDFMEFETNRNKEFLLQMKKLGIILTKKAEHRNIILEKLRTAKLQAKKLQKVDTNEELTEEEETLISSDADRLIRDIQCKGKLKKRVLLGFQAFQIIDGLYKEICQMKFSSQIRSYKDPRIVDISHKSGSVIGGDKILMFIEEVTNGDDGRPDIGVRFFELQDEVRIWSEDAEIEHIHRQNGLRIR